MLFPCCRNGPLAEGHGSGVGFKRAMFVDDIFFIVPELHPESHNAAVEVYGARSFLIFGRDRDGQVSSLIFLFPDANITGSK